MIVSQTRDEAYCPACDRSYGVAGAVCPHDGTRLVRLGKDPMLGRIIDGRFTIRERIGEGGMGVVYRAAQSSVQRDVAMKVMRSRTGVDKVIAKRFLREARLASQLAHPATVAVIDFGQTDDQILYLVMELLRGETLADAIARGEPIGVARACRIAHQLAEALEAAHGQDIVHRDLKPGNVMILDHPPGRDAIKVLDFGLAKAMHDGEEITLHSTSGSVLGTPTYMAPEMATGAALDARVDLYAVGVILYEMLAGQPPFVSTSLHQLISMHATAMPPALGADVSPPLAGLIGRLLAKNPDERVPNATALREELEAIATELGPDRRRFALGTGKLVPRDPPAELAEPPPTRRADSRPSRRRSAIAAAGATAALLGAVAVGAVSAPAELGATEPTPVPTAPVHGPAAADTTAPAPAPTIDLPILSTPSGAIVEVDGVARGLSPITVEVAQGAMVSIRVSLKGFRAKNLQVRADAPTPISIQLARAPLRPFVKP
jgi:eukaryotic-like serine/threonine-protein kinase